MKLQSLEKYLKWCRTILLPFWLDHAIDTKQGGFFETLHFDGSPDRKALRRVRVASRQIYAFSHGHQLNWINANNPILNGVDWLMDRAWAVNGEPGFLHIVDDQSRPLDHTRDLYDHAFHILGLSWAYQATNDAQVLGAAKQALAFVEEALSAKNGGWYENLQQTEPRRQNPHMHMFEALLALYQATKDRAYLKRADQIALLLFERFINPINGFLYENFEHNWQARKPDIIEPGHMVEWSWLLNQRAQISKQTNSSFRTTDFLQLATTIGLQKNGLLIDACDPTGAILQDSCRLWTQCEWLKAVLVRPQTSDRDQLIEQICERIFLNFLNQLNPALWMDAIDTNNHPLTDRVPASIIYHLVSSAAQGEQTLIAQASLEASCLSQ